MRALLISSSTVHGYGFLDQPEPEIRRFLGDRKRVLFVPFALFDRDGYTARVRERLGRMGFDVTGITGASDLAECDAIYVGGGNTWRLLKTLYAEELLEPIGEAVRGGLAYMGASAGSNIAAPTIRTTNDMPIVEVPSMNALGLVRYQINPHYLDADASSTHMGETREERLMQFHEENDTPVVGLREGSTLLVEDDRSTLLGTRTARLFRRGQQPIELPPGSVIEESLG